MELGRWFHQRILITALSVMQAQIAVGFHKTGSNEVGCLKILERLGAWFKAITVGD
jgi:hypothetical protein